MFLHLLDRGQRREFVRAAMHLVAADGVMDLREEDVLARARAEVGIPAEDLPGPARDQEDLLDGLAEAFDAPRPRRVLLLELLVLILSDGDVDDREQELLAAICDRLEVPRKELRRFSDFARRVLALREDGLELLDA